MKGVGQIISIVEKTLGLKLDEESMDYGRFIIHLKFFMRGILFDRKTRTDNIPVPFTKVFRIKMKQQANV